MISVEILYKQLLQNENPFEGLSEFVCRAEDFQAGKASCDIVHDYLKLSGNCQEILQLIKETSTTNAQNVVLLFKALTHILLRLAKDLNIFAPTGQSIVNEVLAHGMKSVFNFMNFKQKASRTRAALHLLSAMVALGNQAAHKVLALLDFSNPVFISLINRSNTSEEEDVRTAFINLIVFLVTVCDQSCIIKLVEIKGFFNAMMPGLVSDNASTIMSLLKLFQQKIVENSDISKTTKLHLFNDSSLKPVIELYSWSGPKKVKVRENSKKRKLGENHEHLVYEVDEQEAEAVRNMAHEFMLSLCCSRKYGIIFKDSTYGTSGRNENHVITNILKLFSNPYSNSLMSEFVISALKACPDQLQFYLPSLRDSFHPRVSVAWCQTVDLLKKIINDQEPVACLFKTQENKPISSLVVIAKALCIPSVITPSELEDTFQNGDPVVCYHLCQLLTCILKQVENIIIFCEQPNLLEVPYSPVDLSSFCHSFLAAVIQSIPFENIFKNYLPKLALLLKETQMKVNSNKNIQTNEVDSEVIDSASSERNNELLQVNQNQSAPTADIELKSKGISVPAISKQLAELLETVKLVKNMYMICHLKFDSNLNEFFSCLKQCKDLFSPEELFTLQMKVIDFLIGKGESTVTLWNKNLADSPLVNLDVFFTSNIPSLKYRIAAVIHKLLLGTGIFDQCKWEADVWIDGLKSAKAKHISSIVGLINDAICALLHEPNNFTDDIVDTTLENSAAFGSRCNSSKYLEDLLLEENIEKENETEHCAQQCFSSFVPAVLMQLRGITDKKKKGCKVFVETALCDIIHHQHYPSIFLAIINKYQPVLSSSMYKYWEMLSSYKINYKIDELADLVSEDICSLKLQEHLRKKFICSHIIKAVCNCSATNVPDDFGLNFSRKTISQILMYISVDISLMIDNKCSSTAVPDYFKLLQNLFEYVYHSEETTEVKEDSIKLLRIKFQAKCKKQEVVYEILSHPIILKLFLHTECLPHSQKDLLKMCVNSCTDLVTNVADKILNDCQFEECYKCLNSFKNKLLNSNSSFEKEHVSKVSLVVNTDVNLLLVIGSFSNILKASNVTKFLENVLSKEPSTRSSDSSSLTLLLKLYVDKAESTFLSADCINSLFSHYVQLPKKQKEICLEYILKIFEMHPSFALLLKSDSCHQLLENPSIDLPIIGFIINYNKCFQKIIQNRVIEKCSKLESGDFIFLVSKCITKSYGLGLQAEEDVKFLEEVSLLFWEELTKFLLTEETSCEFLFQENIVGEAATVLFQKKHLTVKKLSKFLKVIEEKCQSSLVPSAPKLSIYLSLLNIFKRSAEEKTKANFRIMNISFHWLINVVSKLQNPANFSYSPLMDFVQEFLKDSKEVNIGEAVNVEKMFSQFLKVAMKCNELGGKLLNILTALCNMNNSNNLPVLNIYKLIIGHSKFFDIMLSYADKSLKESVIDLLISIIKLNGDVCNENHLGLFLASYGATMSKSDQKLLYLIKLLSDNGIDMSTYRPFLWGKSAITHYSVMNAGNMYLWKQPKLQDVLELFISKKIDYTVLNYPLELDIMPSIHTFDSLCDKNVQPEKVYDLRFLLPLFSNLLSPGSYVHHLSFINSKVLMLIFISLSSFDPKTRAMGFYCLSQFYQHLEGARFREKDIWICLLDSVRNSMTTTNPRIPSIVTLFLAKVAEIFTKPDNRLYKPLYKFIMCKPAIDIGQVPEFFTFFNSFEIEHRVQRMWLINLLVEGLRSSLDFHICEKRGIFNTVLTHYNSSVSTPQEKIALLCLLQSTVKIASSARTLCQRNIISWLHGIIETIGLVDVDILKNVCLLVQNLWITIQNKSTFLKKPLNSDNQAEQQNSSSKDKTSMYISFPHELLLVLLSILKKAKFLDTASLRIYLSTLESVLNFVKNFNVHVTVYTSGLSFDHITQIHDLSLDLFEKSSKFSNSKINEEIKDIKHCQSLLQKISLYWVPLLHENLNEEFYYLNASYVLKVLSLMHFCERSVASQLAVWFYKCLQKDKKYAISKLMFSAEGEECFNCILRQFETSILHKTGCYNEQINFSNLNEPETTFDTWRNVFLHFKLVSETCNLKPTSSFFNEICSIL